VGSHELTKTATSCWTAVAGKFLAAVLSQDKVKRLLSSEHARASRPPEA
jgi:hypothetical protein